MDPALQRLDGVDHLVVLMMENRSFDHLLGYLSLEGGRADVDGLQPGMANEHAGIRHEVHHLPSTKLSKRQDPGHSGRDVDRQLAGANAGFVASYAQVHPDDPDPGVVMGYHDAGDLPVYDHLAGHFCVCDRWFSSVPGATWPNRLYAVAGRADGSRDNRRPLPLYDLPAFTRHLDRSGVSWRWYSHDPGTLHLVDARYRLGPDRGFAFFDRRTLFEPRHFLDDAASGSLPAVSWIDPNFVDLSGFGPPGSNDDHPPSDVMAGQALVLKAFNALVHGRRWDRTLLLIVYDEHGGFYDHVAPPAAPDDDPRFRRYGARVPALVVSPHVQPGSVSSVLFDHASIVKTILLRFCRDAAGAIPAMGTRVARANHLGQALSDAGPFPPPPEPELQAVVDRTADWAADAFRRELAGQAAARHAGADDPSDLQREIIETARVLRASGLRPGRP